MLSRIENPFPSSAVRAERIYQRVDAKADILSDIWRTASSLPRPLSSDYGTDRLTAEASGLGMVIRRARERLPEAFEAFDRSSETEPGSQERESIRLETPDFSFVEAIVHGVANTLQRRRDLRTVQKSVGEPEPNGFYANPDVFASVKGVRSGISKAITRAYLGPLSFTLFVEPDAYDATMATQIKTKGVHFRGGFRLEGYFPASTFSYIREGEDAATFLSRRLINPTDLTQDQRTVLAHEEFHAFADAFYNPSNEYLTIENSVRNKLAMIQEYSLRDGTAGMIAMLEEAIEEDLKRLPDSSAEEIVAELVSSETRKGIPSSTFAVYGPMKENLVALVAGHQPPVGIDPQKVKATLIETARLRAEIGEIYGRADHYIPDKRVETDALFALFTPSRIRQIHRLVERWIEVRRGETIEVK